MSRIKHSIPSNSIPSKTEDNQRTKRDYWEPTSNRERPECEAELSLTLNASRPRCQHLIYPNCEINESGFSTRGRTSQKSSQRSKSQNVNRGDVDLESSSTIDSIFNVGSLSGMKLSEEVSDQSVSYSDSSLMTPDLPKDKSTSSTLGNTTLLEDVDKLTTKTNGTTTIPYGPVLKWEQKELLKLRSWLTCICMVDFDLSLGQTLKFAYPSGQLTDSEEKNVASLAFPDSHSTDVGCYNFCFRFRTSSRPSESDMRYPYLFGFVFFCQKPDSTINRGYFQKSLVLVSHLPFTKLFLRVVAIIGPLFFRYGNSILEASCRNISQWPCPTKGGQLTLPILGDSVKVNLEPDSTPPHSRPARAVKSLSSSQLIYPKEFVMSYRWIYQQNFTQMLALGFRAEVAIEALEKCSNDIDKAILASRTKMSPTAEMFSNEIDLTELWRSESSVQNVSGVFQDVNIYDVFQDVLGSLWFLWECAIAGKPIMVMSQSPEICTKAVLGIMSIISPVIYSGDFRPYFTIYDPDFKHFQDSHKNGNLGSVMLGVTNPFFLKVYKNWENILYLSDPNSENNEGETSSQKASISSWWEPIKVSRRALFGKPILKRSKWVGECEYKMDDRMVSRHSPCLKPDQKILRRLIRHTKSRKEGKDVTALAKEQISAINTTVLRRYFRDMTNCFLRPFHIWLEWDQDLVNRQNFNLYLNPVTLLHFSEEDFLDEIRKAPKDYFKDLPVKGTRSDVVKLYSRFLRSPHFQPWFYSKREEAQAKLNHVLDKWVTSVNFEDLIKGQTMSNRMKMYREIERRIKLNQDSRELKKSLMNHINLIKCATLARNLKGKTFQRTKISRCTKRMLPPDDRSLRRHGNRKYNKINFKH